MTAKIFIGILLLSMPAVALRSAVQQPEPIVRIGLDQNASSVTVRSGVPFTVGQDRTRSARFSIVLAVDVSGEARVYRREDLQHRIVVEVDGGGIIVLPMSSKIRLGPSTAPLQIQDRTYHGVVEVFGNSRNRLTIVNELPLETYLLGVVPNELNPVTFDQLEALKAQAVASRTYVVRNMGQYESEGYDICATQSCQVYFGAGTEHPMATEAVMETRGTIATYASKPILALYSSTCGGRTENVENIFQESLPYLVSVMCEYKHPEPQPFASLRTFPDWKDAVLAVAGVSNYGEARRFLGIQGEGEPPSLNPEELALFIRQTFYPLVQTGSDLSFLAGQGILPPSGRLPQREILFRLIDKKNAFEWQQGVLVSWDGQTMKLLVDGKVEEFRLDPDAPIYQRIGDERVPMNEGAWIGGELIDFRAVDGTIQMLVFRINFVQPAADRYSRLAQWQAHRTRPELDTALQPLDVGELRDVRALERGPSGRLINTEIVGSTGSTVVGALRLRSLLGLRDSLFYFDHQRNARGELLGMTFYGSGWGHGVGMCQVGAYGMALDGASYEEILKKYYTGIELEKLY